MTVSAHESNEPIYPLFVLQGREKVAKMGWRSSCAHAVSKCVPHTIWGTASIPLLLWGGRVGKELLHPGAPGCYLCGGCHYVPPGENASKAVTTFIFICVCVCFCVQMWVGVWVWVCEYGCVLYECITYDAHKLLRDYMRACICV